jgi:hypothetical protein
MSVQVLHHDKPREHDRREESNKSTANHRRKWNDDTNKAKPKTRTEYFGDQVQLGEKKAQHA